ncbi:hypothetical protein P4V60_17105 [Brevibacillus porteri]|nr:hypothetical protein [Brevibacillus porteri]MED2130805.1 hypothetical protein [Brevibacillus porteri]MED2894981.1 hypothetical protein [Brevibacillus porteri]
MDPREVYFFFGKDRIATTSIANEIINVNAWNTVTGVTSPVSDMGDEPTTLEEPILLYMEDYNT